jgi:hypothetical protein
MSTAEWQIVAPSENHGKLDTAPTGLAPNGSLTTQKASNSGKAPLTIVCTLEAITKNHLLGFPCTLAATGKPGQIHQELDMAKEFLSCEEAHIKEASNYWSDKGFSNTTLKR